MKEKIKDLQQRIEKLEKEVNAIKQAIKKIIAATRHRVKLKDVD